MSLLNVTLVQSDILWEKPQENLTHYENLLKGKEPTDCIVLPEMFSSGFSTDPTKEIIEFTQLGVDWMTNLAKKLSCAVCGSMITKAEHGLLNRFYFIDSHSKTHVYDKKHLFGMGGEKLLFRSGKKLTTIQYQGFNIRPIICYDLRFPVWCRNTYNSSNQSFAYDILLVVANWPEKRINHWEKLLQSRAIENQAYVIGVNRIGNDASGIEHNGNSMVVHPSGDILFHAPPNQEIVKTITLHLEELHDYRKKLPFASDWDQFEFSTSYQL